MRTPALTGRKETKLGYLRVETYRAQRRLLARLLKLPPPQYLVAVERNLPVPMPDGVILMADHYYPKAEGSFPTVLIRSVYGRGMEIGRGAGIIFSALWSCFAERGYHVVVQTTRGRLDSGGTFEPLIDSRSDGQTTIKWIAEQSWFNGVMGMWGQSALGYVQWAAAPEAPAYLKAIMPIIITSSGYNLVYPNEAFAFDAMLRWGQLVSAINRKNRRIRWELSNLFARDKQEQILKQAFMHLPLSEADVAATGQPVPFYRNWLNRPQRSNPYWQEVDHSPRLPQVKAAPHLVSGWYDFVLDGLLKDYATLKESGHEPYLTIGPWHHYSRALVGEALREGLKWFDANLKSDKSGLREKPVRIFVMGANQWREMESWPPQTQETAYFLHAQRSLSPQKPEEFSRPDHYTYDPSDPTPVVGGALLSRQAGPKDNRELESRPDVISYTTPPLKNDLEIIGAVKLKLFVRSSLEYTDFYGRLCDVQPSGTSINICDGLFRIEPGKGELQPDGSLLIEINLWATAHRFLRGHSLRLQVSSGAHPRWNRNLGTGEPIATATRMLPAEQTIYHDASHPSALILPVQD